MDTTLSIALSHQVARLRQMDVIANNIANMSTTAFKQENVMFGQYLKKVSGNQPESLKEIAYVQDFGIARNMTDGTLEATGNNLDIALSGNGMFQVKRDNGEMAYTRNGHLVLSDQYMLITSSGQEIMDNSGKPIQIPVGVSDVKIAEDGTISSPSTGIIAKLKVVSFGDNAKLKKIGNNMFSADTSTKPSTDFTILQGMTESSNVQPIIEITKMIQVSRSYIQTAKLMDAIQETTKNALSRIAKIG